MRVQLLTILAITIAGITACGVKGPPIAPERVEPVQVLLDCSPYDPKCDRTATNYVPGLDLNKPEDEKKIQVLEEEEIAAKAAATSDSKNPKQKKKKKTQ